MSRTHPIAASLVAAWCLLSGPAYAQETQDRPKLDVIYVPTPQEVVDRMLEMAQVKGTDFVIDLGCGDGRNVVTAAQKFGSRGFGVDIDPQRIKEANENAEKAGVKDKVEFRIANLLLIIRTLPGSAHAVAAALDRTRWPEVVGSIAGDDTVFVATADRPSLRRLRDRLLGLAGSH